MPSQSVKHKWTFAPRFRRGAFGWRSQNAITRIQQAVSEIKKTAKSDAALAGAGAVLFIEKLVPAIEQVDSSSGALGTAVDRALEELAPVIGTAPVPASTREKWLNRLLTAIEDDGISYLESLADSWGELCGPAETASAWANRLISSLPASSREDLAAGIYSLRAAALSALFHAGRYEEILQMLEGEQFWPRLRWAVKALIAQGKKGEAFRLAENAREANAGYREIDLICEELLLSCGCADEAYSSYGLRAHQKGTNLAWFRAVAKKYPDKPAEQILKDLSELTPGREGSWFAAAKEAKLFDLAIIFANMAPCAPQTLSRAARDHVEKNPGFASEAAITALRWIVDGHGYEISGLDVSLAASRAMQAAANCDREEDVRNRIQTLLARDTPNARFAAQFVARDLDSSGGSGVR